jgi:hypothetical protein
VDPIDVEAARRAWERASQELGVDALTDGAFLEDGHERVEIVALIRGFGTAKGTAVLGTQHAAAVELAAAQGFFPSILSPSYEDYDRQRFEDTLNDWQWFGEDAPPAWYTGRPWS